MAFSLKRLGTLSLAAGFVLGAQATLAGTLTNVSVVPTDPSPGATTTYTFKYTLESNVNADEALLYVTFPNDFTVATGACDRIASITLNPVPMGGTAICRASYGSGNTVGLAVNTTVSGGVSVPGGTEVEIVVNGVTNPAVANNYDFDDLDGTGIVTTQMMDPMFPMVMEKDIAPQHTVTIGSSSAVNGACGSSQGEVFTALNPPSGNLCAAGSASGVTLNSIAHEWTCSGTGGGTTANCSADLGYDLTLSIVPNSSGTITCDDNPVAHGSSTTCRANVSPGYSFTNWSGACSGGGDCVLNNVTSTLNPQANFTLNSYTITGDVSPLGAGSVICNTNNAPVNHGDNTTCTYTANPGYTFVNWSGDCNGATCSLTGVTGLKTVTANFTAPTFAITAAVSPSGAGTATCTPNPVNGGSNATCIATPASGYSFTSWSGDCTGSSCSLTGVNAAKNVTANFAVTTYSISGTASPVAGGSVSCSSGISSGGNGACSASANAGYAFTGWSGCPSATGTSCNFTGVTSNQSVTANFTINSYTVAATASPIDAGSASCTSPVTYGSTSTCTAKAAAGYRFTGWSGACSGTSCSIASVTANSSVTATFSLLPTFNVTTQVTPADSGTITCSKDILEGGTGTCTTKPKAGYRFKAWGGDCSGTDTSCKLENVTAGKSVSATFEGATTFTITGSLQSLGGYSTTMEPYTFAGLNGPRLLCSQPNPVTINSTVTCYVPGFAQGLENIGDYKGWGGDCSRVEGQNCIIENVTTDKHITIYYGQNVSDSSIVSILPTGAGSVWCDNSLSIAGVNADHIKQHCTAEANPGYAFTAFTNADNGTVNANFTKQANTSVVACTNCTNSALTTDTTTTNTTSKTSEPDANGDTTQSTVAVTTDDQGKTHTAVTVGGTTTGGVTLPVNEVNVTDGNAIVNVNNNGMTSVVVEGSNGTSTNLNVSSTIITGSFSGVDSSSTTTFSASGTNGIRSEVYNFEFTDGGNSNEFSKPVSIKLPPPDTSDLDTDLLTLAKIINGKLEYYGGKYNAEGKYFEAQRKSFKPRAKSASNDYAYISTEWSEGVKSNLQMEGTEQNTLIKNTVTLDEDSPVSIQTRVTIANGKVETTLNVGNDTNNVTGNIIAGSASIKVTGVLGNFNITDKQRPENDSRAASLTLVNGQLDSIGVSSDQGTQSLYTAAADANAPKATGFESSADSFSVTLSYPAAKK